MPKMSRSEILKQIEEILQDEFEDDGIEVTDETSAADIEEWDSLAHLSIIHEVETAFHIRFTIGEIQEFKNVGEMADSIEKHMKG